MQDIHVFHYPFNSSIALAAFRLICEGRFRLAPKSYYNSMTTLASNQLDARTKLEASQFEAQQYEVCLDVIVAYGVLKINALEQPMGGDKKGIFVPTSVSLKPAKPENYPCLKTKAKSAKNWKPCDACYCACVSTSKINFGLCCHCGALIVALCCVAIGGFIQTKLYF